MFLVGVKFRLVTRTVQMGVALNMKHPVQSCIESLTGVMFSKLGNLE